MSSGFQFSGRRNFIKKSLAVSVAASQPVFLAGLIRASGGGGGTGTSDKYTVTTDPYTEFPYTTDPYDYTSFPNTETTEYGTGGYYYY